MLSDMAMLRASRNSMDLDNSARKLLPPGLLRKMRNKPVSRNLAINQIFSNNYGMLQISRCRHRQACSTSSIGVWTCPNAFESSVSGCHGAALTSFGLWQWGLSVLVNRPGRFAQALRDAVLRVLARLE